MSIAEVLEKGRHFFYFLALVPFFLNAMDSKSIAVLSQSLFCEKRVGDLGFISSLLTNYLYNLGTVTSKLFVL